MNIARTKRQINNIGDGGSFNRRILFKKPGRIGPESDCMFGQLSKILESSDSGAGLKVEKVGVA